MLERAVTQLASPVVLTPTKAKKKMTEKKERMEKEFVEKELTELLEMTLRLEDELLLME